MGLIGTLFTAAAVRSIVSSQVPRRQQWHQLGLVVLLVLIFGTELVGGIVLLANAASSTAVQFMSFRHGVIADRRNRPGVGTGRRQGYRSYGLAGRAHTAQIRPG